MKIKFRLISSIVFMVFMAGTGFAGSVAAASATEIDMAVDASVAEFRKDVTGGAEFLDKAKGYLVFPKVTKAGLVVGGEYGEGALRIGGKSEAYYNIASASFGLQIGAQQYAIVMVFLEDDAMKKFRESKGWEAGVDGSVAIAKWGAGEDINTQNFKDPIVGFVFGNKGLMAGISLEGSKITKLDK
ncbi:MAG: BPSL1445 family SYLF domain-containing lipoprotein [Thiogranum sp.]